MGRAAGAPPVRRARSPTTPPPASPPRLQRIEKEREPGRNRRHRGKRASSPPTRRSIWRLLLQRADMTLLRGEGDLEVFRRSPQSYEELFSVNVYLDRDYAPTASPSVCPSLPRPRGGGAPPRCPTSPRTSRARSRSPSPRRRSRCSKGYADYLRKDAREQLKGVGSRRFEKLAPAVQRGARSRGQPSLTRLAKVEVKKGDSPATCSAPARYRELLESAGRGLHVALAEALKMGGDNLAANKRAYDELVQKKVGCPPVAKQTALFAEAGNVTACRAPVHRRERSSPPSHTEDQAIVKGRLAVHAVERGVPRALPGLFEEASARGVLLHHAARHHMLQEGAGGEYLSPHGIILLRDHPRGCTRATSSRASEEERSNADRGAPRSCASLLVHRGPGRTMASR